MAGVCVVDPIDAVDFERRKKLREIQNRTRAEAEQMWELDRRLAHSMHSHISPAEACEMACGHSHNEKQFTRHNGCCSKPGARGFYPKPVARWLTPQCIALLVGMRHARRKRGIPGESALVPPVRSVFVPARKRA
jgi:hypothetical protein